MAVGSASAQTSCLPSGLLGVLRADECIRDDGVWAARAHKHGNGDERPEDVCWLELDVEACLHENIEQLTTSVIVALCVSVARQCGQAKLKSVCIAVSFLGRANMSRCRYVQ